MNLEQFGIFLNRYANNKSTPEEEHLYNDFFESYQETDAVAEPASVQDALKARIFSGIQQNIKKETKRIHLPAFIKVAAAILVMVATGIGIYYSHTANAQIVAYTKKGEHKAVLLSDGSVVTLNADSRLTYPKKFDDHNRTVFLEGEAFFNVTKNKQKPFIVNTNALQTTVLGTSFDIEAYKGELNIVTVATGKVKVVSGKGKSTVIITPGQQASQLRGGLLSVHTVDAADYTVWDKGVLFLNETPLATLAKKLERKYNVHISLAPGLAGNNCLFNGKLSDDGLQNVLENLRFMSGMDYALLNDSTVVISRVSCK